MCEKFSELKEQFLAWAEKALSESSVNVYRHYLDKFQSAFNDPPIAKVTPSMLTQWARRWHELQAVKRLFRWAHAEAALIDTNPISDVRHPPKGHRRRIMTPTECARIIRAVKPDLRELLIGYRETMARPHELRMAKWTDLKPDVACFSLRESLVNGRVSLVYYEYKCFSLRKNPEQPRVILLSPRCCRLLLRLYDRAASHDGHIFKTRKARPWSANALRCRFRRLRKKLGMKRDNRGENVVPYSFRHSFATLAAAAGVRDRRLADILGHVDTKTTSRYLHLQLDHLRDAMGDVWDAAKEKMRAKRNEKRLGGEQ